MTFLGAVGLLFLLYSTNLLQIGFDWRTSFYPATQNVLHGKSPYEVQGFVNVPWTVLILLPFAILPSALGAALFVVTSMLIYDWVAHKLGADPAWIIIFYLSPFVLGNLYFGNLDSLALLGLVLTPPIGIFFVLIKPQIGVGIAFFWLFSAWQKGKLLEVFKVFAPVSIALVVCYLLFGNWTAGQTDVVNASWNTSWFPYSIPVVVVLIVRAIRFGNKKEAIAASPFFSPYVAYPSWVGVLLSLIPRKFELAVAVVAMYLSGIVGLILVGLH